MRRLIFLMALALTASAFAQSPEKLSYQAVIRNSNNQLDTSAVIGMRISILQGSASGTPVYVETQIAQTNSNGLVTVEIGTGAVVSGSFVAINWANGPYFAKIETDPSEGTNYSIIGTSQLLSVPYALYAKKAASASETDPVFGNSLAAGITAADTLNWNHKLNEGHYVGELFGGGVVFYVDQKGKHGLICSMVAPGENQQWSNIQLMIGTSAESDWDGQGNSNAIIAQPGHTFSAAHDCDAYINADYGTGIYSDWYLPALGQLIKLYNSLYEVNKTIGTDGNNSTTILYKTVYWSSTEYNDVYSFYFDFNGGGTGWTGKYNFLAVRAIRNF